MMFLSPLLLFMRVVGTVGVVEGAESINDGLVSSQILTDPYSEYAFPQKGSNGANLFPMPLCNHFGLEEAGIDAIQARLSARELTSVQLLRCYLERIYETNSYVK
jgi:amidase